MSLSVLKFGGSSLANLNNINQVIGIIEETEGSIVVVLSAMGGVTDELYFLADRSSKGKSNTDNLSVSDVIDKYSEVANGLVNDKKQLSSYLKYLDLMKSELVALFSSVEVTGELTPRVKARIVSYGETMMARLMDLALKCRSLSSCFIDSAEIISLADEIEGFEPIEDLSLKNCKDKIIPKFRDYNIVVVQGFIGATSDSKVMTLGRGGSDYSATLYANFLNADKVILYKEVNGLMTCDPRYVKNARVISELHYREATELAYYGAKVLHPRSIIPLVNKKIPLFIKNTFDPYFEGTLISDKISPTTYPVKALTSMMGQCIINVEGKGMLGVPGVSARVFSCLASSDISVSLITQASSEASICFIVSSEDKIRASKALEKEFKYELSHELIDKIKAESDVAIIAVVGLGMSGTKGVSARVFGCFYKEDINVRAIAQGSSELNISIVIDEDDALKALNAIHKEYSLHKIKVLGTKSKANSDLVLYGFGQIGQTLTKQIEEQRSYFSEKLEIDLPIIALCDSSGALMSDTCDGFDSMDLDYAKEIKAKGEKFEPNHKPLNSNEWVHILDQHVWSNKSQATILVDNTATESFDILFESVKQGGHIVTANKKPLAVDQLRYDALFDLAKENNCSIRYEATVGAGLPVIDSIEKLESSGDEIRSILGCLSGTLGYLMSSMEKGMLFSDAVREAYEKGFTEPDPREDLSGMDVARKALILARRLGCKLNIEDIKLESLYRPEMSSSDADDFIENLSALDGYFDSRIKEANKNNCVLRYVARIENGNVSVGVENIPVDTPLGSLKGTDNQITITTRRYESNPLVVTGPGAGAEVTAAGVLNDIVAITMNGDKV